MYFDKIEAILSSLIAPNGNTITSLKILAFYEWEAADKKFSYQNEIFRNFGTCNLLARDTNDQIKLILN